MKKVIVLMLGLVAGTASFAQPTPVADSSSVMMTTGPEKIKLFVAPQATTATINLLNEQGHVLYKQKVNLQNGFRQNFNLSELEPGMYQMVVLTDGQRVIKTFVVDQVPAQKRITLQA